MLVTWYLAPDFRRPELAGGGAKIIGSALSTRRRGLDLTCISQVKTARRCRLVEADVSQVKPQSSGVVCRAPHDCAVQSVAEPDHASPCLPCTLGVR